MFSASCRIIARQLSNNAENHNRFAEEQFGSRRGRDALVQATNMRVIMDLAKQSRIPMSIVGNDLASCYDRISHLVAAMAYRASGAAQSVVEMRFKTVQQEDQSKFVHESDSGLLLEEA